MNFREHLQMHLTSGSPGCSHTCLLKPTFARGCCVLVCNTLWLWWHVLSIFPAISYYEGYSEKSYFSPAASTGSNAVGGSWFLVYFKHSDQDPTFKTFHPPTVETCLLLWAVAFLVCLFLFDDGPRIHRLTRAVQLPFRRCMMYSFCRRVDLTYEPYETDSDSNGVMVSKCVLVHWPSCAHWPFHQVALL